jgi:Fe-S-cluster-containing hydrogenase component 2
MNTSNVTVLQKIPFNNTIIILVIINIRKDELVMNSKTLVVIKENCPQNHPCPSVPICPVAALKQTAFDAPTVDLDDCIRCGKCTNFCPKKALVLV